MHDPKLIEAMARAVYEARNGYGCKAWARLPELYHAPYKHDATAALTALCALHPGVRALIAGEAVAVPRLLLDGLVSEAESAINEACCVRDFKPHPALAHRYNRDMEDVREARRLLAASPYAQEASDAG